MSARIDSVLQAAVDAGDVPGVVAMAADATGPIYEGAAGPRAAGGSEPLTPDTMLWLASMTKIVTTAAALQLAERGRLDLDAPVEEYRPEFTAVQVLDGFDGDVPRLRAPASRATVRRLVTHTSGLGYWFFNADIVRWEEATGTPNVLSGSEAIFDAPLVADPGTRWEYGIGTDWLGRVVESASGQALDAYLAEHILGPLGMSSTTYVMNEEQRATAAALHRRDEDGAWEAQPQGAASEAPAWWPGGHGLQSTPRDYLSFQRMLLGGGALGDTRILEESTVDAAFANQIGALDVPAQVRSADPASSADLNAGPGRKFGYGLLLTTEQRPGMRAAGSGAWAGLRNTYFWVDRASGVTGALFTQTLPFLEPRVLQTLTGFEQALYASIAAGSVRSRRFERIPHEVPRSR